MSDSSTAAAPSCALVTVSTIARIAVAVPGDFLDYCTVYFSRDHGQGEQQRLG